MVSNEKFFKKNIKFGDQYIGEGNPVFLIAEIGINHNGDLNKAIDLIKAAKESGADTAKLQTYVTEKRVTKDNPVYDILKKCELSFKDHKELFDFAKSINFKIFSTAFDDDSIYLLEELNTPAYKIASFDSVNKKLISKIEQTNKPVIMSTGMTTKSELDEALNIISKNRTKETELAIMHCVSSYPLKEDEANLATINYLKSFFPGPVGFSDHSLTDTLIKYSVASGSTIIEKHFTLSREDEGPDHKLSADPKMLKEIVSQIKNIKKIFGEKFLGVRKNEKNTEIFRRPS
jgi:N,N'-diacetyllegionaminate synthase